MSAIASDKFGSEVLLIFLGHSSDTDALADVIYDLERELQRLLDQHLSVSAAIPFKTVRMWEWRKDGLPLVGGQEQIVTAAINRANIAVFVFKERIGAVSWDELNQSRNRENPPIPVLAFFPTDSPPDLNDEDRIAKWLDLVKKRSELVKDWSAPNSKALRPMEKYKDEAHLKALAVEQLSNAVISLLKSEPSARGPVSVEVLPAKFLADHSHLSYDRQPVLTRSLDELDQDLLRDLLAKPLSQDLNADLKPGRDGKTPTVSEQLENLGCIYAGRPTLGAFLCFAPTQLLADKSGCCTLQMAIHDASERGGEKAQLSLARGNLLFLYKRGMSWLTSGTVLRRRGRIGSGGRDDLEIPEIVLREALVNALVHRDYDSKVLQDQPTRIDVYPDKVEITSYGLLLEEVPIDLLNNPDQRLRPFRRNPVIAGIFQCMTLAELNASGIQRMRRVMTEGGLALPLFRTSDNYVCVTLARPFELSNSRELIQSAPTTAITTRTAFISSTRELSEHRRAALDACFRAGVIPIFWSESPPSVMDIVSALKHMIDEADICIFILGNRYGSISERDGISFTELEYNHAAERGLPMLVFTMHKDHPVTVDAVQTDAEGREKLTRFKERVAKQRLWAEFKSPEDLRSQIIQTLAALPVPEVPAPKSTPVKADISRIIKYAPTELIGREAETTLLDDAWAKVQSHAAKRQHILTFVALGGEGKTSLVAKWAASLAHRGWPGCDAVFAWSFYSQGTREQTAASSDLFLVEALTFFGDAAMAGSAAGAFDKGRRLAQLVGERRALLILDGLEPLQYAPTSPTAGELKDQGLAALLKGLAANSHGMCVVTTRYAIPDLRAFLGKTVREEKLTRLSTEAGEALLLFLGVKGSLRNNIPSADGRALWNEYEKLVEDVKGHALTLNLLGSYLRDAHAGDIRQRDLIKLEEADAEEQGGHAFRVMDAYVRSFESGGKTAEDQEKGRRALALLQLLGLFDRPATADCLIALWQPPAIAGLTEPLIGLSEAQRNLSLKQLEDAKLLTVNRADGTGELVAFDSQPLLREYFARRVRQQRPEAWRAAHQRLYEHLCATTPDKSDATLKDLRPLYDAVAHGCQAGLQQEACNNVYRSRILRRDQYYSATRLGAMGTDLMAISYFFETPWSRVSPSLNADSQGWLLNEAAFRLRALGRLTEALEPMGAGLDNLVKQESWRNAAAIASNLSELDLALGEVARAVGDAERSVTLADRSGDVFLRGVLRGTLADALYQAGRWAEADARFREAEQMQAEHQPDYPLMYSLHGFRYCDLLLTEAERAAWQSFVDISLGIQDEPAISEQPKGVTTNEAFADCCRAVSERAAQTLKWAEERLDIHSSALDHLTLGRAALYAAILEKSAIRNSQSEIDAAVSGLRRAGTQDHLPRGLLTRAWLRSLTGSRTGPESAQSDLDEAWEIAERGPMKLHMADIHLYRARLFFREPSYPWQSPQDDLAAAEKLINDCGYHRRDEELADAKQAILGQALR